MILDSMATKTTELAHKVTDIAPNAAKPDGPDEWFQLSFD